jgi:hypothetical protein
MQLDQVGGMIFIASALIFGAAALSFAPAQRYKTYAEWGAIAGAGIWALGKLT